MMNDDLDHKITQLLRNWETPAPAPDAVGRILAAAQAAPARLAVLRRRMLIGGPALAAALAVGIIAYMPHQAAPKNDPLLAQSALSVFSIASANPDAEELP